MTKKAVVSLVGEESWVDSNGNPMADNAGRTFIFSNGTRDVSADLLTFPKTGLTLTVPARKQFSLTATAVALHEDRNWVDASGRQMTDGLGRTLMLGYVVVSACTPIVLTVPPGSSALTAKE